MSNHIPFKRQGTTLTTRRGDTEVRVELTKEGWSLDWHTFTMTNECEAYWECAHHKRDYEELEPELLEEDGYCKQCPRNLVEYPSNQFLTADEWKGSPPVNVNEARERIVDTLKANLVTHKLLCRYENFSAIMYGTWVDGDNP